MIEKTEALILNSIKYGDSSLVIQCYTEEFGRISLLARGIRRKSKSRPRSTIQPLQLFSVTISKKETREMSLLREADLVFITQNTHIDVKRSAIAIFIADLLSHILREEEKDSRLFMFLREAVIELDRINEGLENFHLYFCVRLAEYIGISPIMIDEAAEPSNDFENGRFIKKDSEYNKGEELFNSDLYSQFSLLTYETLGNIKLSGEQRNRFLISMLKFYSHHLPGSGNLKSLAVLTEIFR